MEFLRKAPLARLSLEWNRKFYTVLIADRNKKCSVEDSDASSRCSSLLLNITHQQCCMNPSRRDVLGPASMCLFVVPDANASCPFRDATATCIYSSMSHNYPGRTMAPLLRMSFLLRKSSRQRNAALPTYLHAAFVRTPPKRIFQTSLVEHISQLPSVGCSFLVWIFS